MPQEKFVASDDKYLVTSHGPNRVLIVRRDDMSTGVEGRGIAAQLKAYAARGKLARGVEVFTQLAGIGPGDWEGPIHDAHITAEIATDAGWDEFIEYEKELLT